MATFHWILEQRFNKWGWGYDWYSSDPGEDPYTVMLSWSPALQLAWQGVHNNHVILEALRVINDDKPRLSALRKFTGIQGTAGATPAMPNYSIKLQLVGSEGAKRFMQLRGLPQTWPAVDESTGAPDLPGVASTAVLAWGQALITAGFAIKRRIGADVLPFRRLLAVSASATPVGMTNLTVQTPFDAVAGDRIFIGSVNECQVCGINGIWTILAVAGATITIDRPWNLAEGVTVNLETGQVRIVEYALSAMTAKQVYSVGSRDTGRPFGLSRGRSSGASCRR